MTHGWVRATDIDGTVAFVNLARVATMTRHRMTHQGRDMDVTTLTFPEFSMVEVDKKAMPVVRGEPANAVVPQHGTLRVRQTPEELMAQLERADAD